MTIDERRSSTDDNAFMMGGEAFEWPCSGRASKKPLLHTTNSDKQQACATAHATRADEWDSWKSVRDMA